MEADIQIKALVKSNAKPALVAVHEKEFLQELAQYPHCEPGRATQPRFRDNPANSSRYSHTYKCPECEYEWSVRGSASVAFVLTCPNEYFKHKLDATQRVTYISLKRST